MTDTPKDNTPNNSQSGKLNKQSIEQMKSNFLYGAGSKSGVGYGQLFPVSIHETEL